MGGKRAPLRNLGFSGMQDVANLLRAAGVVHRQVSIGKTDGQLSAIAVYGQGLRPISKVFVDVPLLEGRRVPGFDPPIFRSGEKRGAIGTIDQRQNRRVVSEGTALELRDCAVP